MSNMKAELNPHKILSILEQEYTEVKGTSLEYGNALELMVATMLSAQCTDERVNEVTSTLFKEYRTAEDYAKADLEDLKEIIRPTGFYRRKAEFIKKATKKLVEYYDSEIPRSIEELTKFPGIARKTANVILSNAFNINQGIAVDTHVMRLSKRLGLTQEMNRDKIEKDLMNLFSEDQWSRVTSLLIAHGRTVCTARNPKCKECALNEICPSSSTFD